MSSHSERAAKTAEDRASYYKSKYYAYQYENERLKSQLAKARKKARAHKKHIRQMQHKIEVLHYRLMTARWLDKKHRDIDTRIDKLGASEPWPPFPSIRVEEGTLKVGFDTVDE